MELKEHQPSMSVDEQLENLKAIGLKIDDEDYARQILNDISYFRLIKAYGLGLKRKNTDFDGSIADFYSRGLGLSRLSPRSVLLVLE